MSTWSELKARAIVGQDRVRGLAVGADGSVSATVDGEHGIYEVRRRPNGVWSCTCPAWWYGRCSHVLAVQILARQAARQPPGDS